MRSQTCFRSSAARACVSAILLTLPAILSYAAEEGAAESLPTRFRIIGLFSPDRRDDLSEVFKQIPQVQVVDVDFENAEVTLAYEAAKFLPEINPKQGYTPQKIVERLNNLVRTASNHTFAVSLPSGTPKDKLTPLEISVGILDCKGCCLAVYESIASLDGVERAVVVGKTGQLTAWIDPAKTDRAAVEAALTKAHVPLKPKP